MGVILRVEDLVCGYGDADVITGITLSVREGEFLGIIGPNGSGKTTLFRAIAGLIAPRKGRIIYKGRDTSAVSRAHLAEEVAILPQFLEANFPFTVEEFVMMGRYPHMSRLSRETPQDRQAVDKALAATGTVSLRGRRISDLSGGERQRCLLAQGLAQEPTLLLLDEPTAHLDIGHQIEALDLLSRLNREEGITVLIVLHDLNMAGEYCERLLLLSGGRVHREGAPRNVLTYQAIEEVYKTVVVVSTNPVSSSPHVLPIPGYLRRQR